MLRFSQLTLLACSTTLLLAATACDPGPIELDEDAEMEDEEGELNEEEPEGPEPCESQGDMRACDDGEGTQFCGGWNDPAWGECLHDFECMPGETRSCGLELGIDQGCVVGEDGVPRWNLEACNTPLVLSFDAGPVEMVTSSAAFDISGVGACYDTDWPAARTPWLAVDLDKNGFIDGGHELFGSGTVLAGGAHAQNGFLALESFDSNGDGKVSELDERFSELLVWRDEDADKRSLPHELNALSDEGVRSIDLDYGVREQCDDRGNCGRERSSFEFAGADGRVQVGEVVDVYLACQ